jgi:hypothetical protein
LSKQTLVVIAAAVILFAVAIGASLAFIGGDDDSDDNVHTMPGGQTMTEPMETSPDMGDQMP